MPSFVDILLNRDITSLRYCHNFEKIRKMIDAEPALFASVLEDYESETVKKLQKYKTSNENYGFAVSAFLDVFRLLTNLLRRKRVAEKKQVLNNVEFALISALKKDFKKQGLFMVDTLEKVKAVNITSKVEFDDHHVYPSHKEKNYRFKDYIEGLATLFMQHSLNYYRR